MAYEEIFQRVAGKYGLDWRLMAEQCFQESHFDPLAVGAANEMGLMQIPPAIWDEWSPKVGVYDPFDPESNITVAGAYMAWISEQLVRAGHPEPYWLLAAYDWGANDALRLLQSGGAWKDVPDVRRDYATSTILAAEANAVAEQITPGAEPVHG
jgi:membrane-bound lytic murein transglycosylase F